MLRTRSPQFARTFTLDYIDHNDEFSNEFDQWAKLELYQRKTQFADLSRHKMHADCVFTLRSIYHIPVRRQVRELSCGGFMIPRVMDVAHGSERSGVVEFKISAQKRANKFFKQNEVEYSQKKVESPPLYYYDRFVKPPAADAGGSVATSSQASTTYDVHGKLNSCQTSSFIFTI